MEPTTPTGVLRILPTTKLEIARFAKGVVQSVLDGTANPLEIHVMLKAFDKASELIVDEIRSNVMAELDKYSEKSIHLFGVQIDKTEVATKYNYSTSKDPEWERLDVEVNTATERRKAREAFLRTLREPMTLVNEETGEVYKISPPLKTSVSGVKITV